MVRAPAGGDSGALEDMDGAGEDVCAVVGPMRAALPGFGPGAARNEAALGGAPVSQVVTCPVVPSKHRLVGSWQLCSKHAHCADDDGTASPEEGSLVKSADRVSSKYPRPSQETTYKPFARQPVVALLISVASPAT
jgi:hypothetical protein